jgi:hypothetical protein
VHLGAPVVRMNLGSVPRGEDNRKQGVDRCVQALNQMLPLASDLGTFQFYRPPAPAIRPVQE